MHPPKLSSADWFRVPPAGATLGIVAFAYWLANHPYGGFNEHDARLYAVLAMHWLDPAAYARDPFFMFGSQGNYSLFTPLYGVLVASLGLGAAAKTVVFVGAALWIGAAVLLARRSLDHPGARWFAVLLVAVLVLGYSPTGETFALNERFATARSLAFPFAALAIAALPARSVIPGAAFALLATLLHPLVGIWVFALVVADRVGDRAIVVLLAGTVAVAAFLAWLGWPPMQPMHDDWLDVVRASTRDVLFPGWSGLRANEYLFAVALLLWAATLRSDAWSRRYRLIALIALVGALAAQSCSHLFPAQLLVQAQPWRGMWVVVYVSLFAVADATWIAFRRGGAWRWAVLAAYPALYLLKSVNGYLLFAAWIAYQLVQRPMAARLAGGRHVRSGRMPWLLVGGLWVIAMPQYVQDLLFLGRGVLPGFRTGVELLDGFLVAGGLGLGVLAIAVMSSARRFACAGLPAMLCAVPLLAYAATNWDQRAERYRQWESRCLGTTATGELAKAVGRGAVVLWLDDNPLRTWLEIGTASYGSPLQAVGMVFSREKTIELQRRLHRVAIAARAEAWPISDAQARVLLARSLQDVASSGGNPMSLFADITRPVAGAAGLRFACQDDALDWVISREGLGLPAPGVRRVADPTDGSPLFLYACADVRQLP